MPNHSINSSRREVVLAEPTPTGPGVAIYDVRDLLPRSSTSLTQRPKQAIKYLTLHHAASSWTPGGFQGLYDCAAFCIRPLGTKVIVDAQGHSYTAFTGRGMLAIAYHFWIPFDDDVVDVYRAIYRGRADMEEGANCKGINHVNVGIALQGDTTQKPMSQNQQVCLTALIPHLLAEYGIADANNYFGHNEANKFGGEVKPSCPGEDATRFMIAQREYLKAHEPLI